MDSENESSRDCLTDSSSEEDLSEVQDFRFDLGMEEDESMRKDTGHGEKQTEQNTTNNQKWLPHLNFEQSESDIDDPKLCEYTYIYARCMYRLYWFNIWYVWIQHNWHIYIDNTSWISRKTRKTS